MRERPILFSAPMVRAILDGKKSQTRRLVKVHHVATVYNAMGSTREEMRDRRVMPANLSRADIADPSLLALCPYGAPGDRLWVREACELHDPDPANGFDEPWVTYREDGGRAVGGWRSPIHMPRWASRITLDVVACRVERLHDITEEDARAEGMEHCDVKGHDDCFHGGIGYRCAFEELWREINGAASWAANPWVWVVGFTPAATGKDGR